MNEHQRKVMFSSGNDEWETPIEIYEPANKKYKFTQDVCAAPSGITVIEKIKNEDGKLEEIEVEIFTQSKCDKFYTLEDDALTQDWSGETNWMNMPYSKAKAFVSYAYEQCQADNTIVVGLGGARTETNWFEFVWKYAANIYFYNKRIQFLKDGVKKSSAGFPSVLWEFNSQIVREGGHFYKLEKDGLRSPYQRYVGLVDFNLRKLS